MRQSIPATPPLGYFTPLRPKVALAWTESVLISILLVRPTRQSVAILTKTRRLKPWVSPVATSAMSAIPRAITSEIVQVEPRGAALKSTADLTRETVGSV